MACNSLQRPTETRMYTSTVRHHFWVFKILHCIGRGEQLGNGAQEIQGTARSQCCSSGLLHRKLNTFFLIQFYVPFRIISVHMRRAIQ